MKTFIARLIYRGFWGMVIILFGSLALMFVYNTIFHFDLKVAAALLFLFLLNALVTWAERNK